MFEMPPAATNVNRTGISLTPSADSFMMKTMHIQVDADYIRVFFFHPVYGFKTVFSYDFTHKIFDFVDHLSLQ